MPTIEFHNVGKVGVVKDVKPHLLPPEVWSDANNVRFRDGSVSRMLGHVQVLGTPTVAPHFILGLRTITGFSWIYTSLAKAYAIEAGIHTNITRTIGGDYTSSFAQEWNGTVFQGIPIVNNGIDVPQFWATIIGSTPLANLTNWPAGVTAKVIRSYKNFLVALNITDSGTNKPHRVRWSHSADPGTLPTSWDTADPTKDAGEIDLSDVNSGHIREGLLLGDSLAIYKDESTWLMRFIGGINIFSIQQKSTNIGVLTARCVASTPKGDGHVIATGEDLILFNGQSFTSLLDKKMKNFITNDISPTGFAPSFCFTNFPQDEVLFVYVPQGATVASRALVWNMKDGTISVRDWIGTSVSFGIIEDISTETWAADPDLWSNADDAWSNFRKRLTVVASPTQTKIFQIDQSSKFDGVNFDCFVERTGLAFIGRDREGNPKADFKVRKLAKRIWPKMSGGPVNVRLGAQESEKGVINWAPSQVFNPDTQQYLDFTVNGRLIAVNFSSTDDSSWNLEGYDLELDILGVH